MSSGILNKIEKSSNKTNGKSKLIVGNVRSRFIGKIDRKTINKIDKKLSYMIQGAFFSEAYREGVWDGRIRLFSKRTNSFPTGFVSNVIKILDTNKIKHIVIDKRKKIEIDDKTLDYAMNSLHNFVPRKYQKRAVEEFIKSLMGVINLPTGSGKTAVMAMIIRVIDTVTNNNEKHLIVTHGTSLLSQLRKSLSTLLGEEIGYIAESKWIEKRITVASIDSLHSFLSGLDKIKFKKTRNIEEGKRRELKLKKKKTETLLRSVIGVYSDEAHMSPAKTFRTVLNKCTNAYVRFGCTATYDRSGGDKMMLKAVTGKIIYKKSLSWMIENGYLAKPVIILIEFGRKTDIHAKDWHDQYSSGISANDKRNLLITSISKILIENNLSSVLFVTHKNQGSFLYKNILVHSKDTAYLIGEDNQKTVRKPTLNAFRNGRIRTIICTRILNLGIDFPEANAGIKCGGQKYGGNTTQQLGRILRKYKEKGKLDVNRKEEQIVFWLDICDMHDQKLAEHSLERIKVYESEPAFNVNYANDIEEVRRIINANIKKTKIIKHKENTSQEKRKQKKINEMETNEKCGTSTT